MAAKKNKLKDKRIACEFYIGLLSKMPEEAKERMKAEKPEVYKQIFKD